MEYVIHLRGTSGKKIYVDPEGGEGFYLYPGEIKKEKLTEGDSVREEDLERIRREYAVPRAKKRALGLLVKKDRTEKEIRDKLKDSVNDQQSVEEAVKYVRSFGYVDDLNYARDYLYYKKSKKSYPLIRQELKQKGISSEILDLIFEEAGPQKEEDLLPQIRKYIRKFDEMDATAKKKTCAHFCRKGYSSGLIKNILENPDFFE
ncbi:MAG: regulatory protein RecX [Lachnospiraceae bacterium]|nr:regulatory protein RecX [Lachnospiraceae bacterium]